jgi:hypothetical protein
MLFLSLGSLLNIMPKERDGRMENKREESFRKITAVVIKLLLAGEEVEKSEKSNSCVRECPEYTLKTSQLQSLM